MMLTTCSKPRAEFPRQNFYTLYFASYILYSVSQKVAL